MKPEILKQFDEDNLYYPWLLFRRAWPTRMDRYVMPVLWVLSGLIVAGIAALAFVARYDQTHQLPSWMSSPWFWQLSQVASVVVAFMILILPI